MSAAADSSAPPPCRRFNYRRSQRGYTLLWLVILLAGGATIYRGNQLVHEAADRQIKQEHRTAEKMSEAKRALMNHFIAQIPRYKPNRVGSGIKPRYLQFPCPDNASDKKLDGVPDAPCGKDVRGTDIIGENTPDHLSNHILLSGSRFGRLPWKTKFDFGTTHLGFNNPKLFDAAGNRLWYAVSRNVAPRKKSDNPIPLNLHYLSLIKEELKEEEWLTVRDETGGIISNRVMAAMLSPGPIIGTQKRYAEAAVETMTITLKHRKIPNDSPLHAENFFEAVYATITISEDEVVTLLANYDRDGDFVQSRGGIITSAYQFENEHGEIKTIFYTMNDQIAYLSLDELIRPRGEFMRNFEGYLGINPKVQNAPLRNSPLAQLKTAAEGFYSAFGFYPNPAPINEDNAGTRNRHCSPYSTANPPEDESMPEFVTRDDLTVTVVYSPTPLPFTEIHFPNSVTIDVTMTVTDSAGLETVIETVTVTSMASTVEIEGRVTVTVGPSWLIDDGFPVFTSTVITRVSVFATVFAPGATLFIVNPGTLSVFAELHTLSSPLTLYVSRPLSFPKINAAFVLPTDFTAGFWPEHNQPPMTLTQDKRTVTFPEDTHASFLLTATMTAMSVGKPVTVTINPEDKIVFPRDGKIKLWENEKNITDIFFPDGTYVVQDGITVTLDKAKPTSATFRARQLAIIATRKMTVWGMTLTASSFLPRVIYPWRSKAGKTAITRDNLHPYPPCWDSHDFFDERFRAFIEDFPTYYAVGNSESITVEIDSGIIFAMPRAHRINIGATATIFLREGDLPPPRDNGGELRIDGGGNMAYQRKNGGSFSAVLSGQFTLSPPILIDFGDARISLAQPLIIAPGDILTFPKDTAFIADSTATISQVDALMIFSPGPLSRVNCDSHGDNCISQTRPTAALDAADVRAYLDNAENTDGDSVFTINRRRIKKNAPQFNDHFLLFGGRVDNSKLDPL